MDTKTGHKVGECKTIELAIKARNHFEKYGLPESINGFFTSPSDKMNPWNAASKRMKHPNGDLLPETPKHSNIRKIELD